MYISLSLSICIYICLSLSLSLYIYIYTYMHICSVCFRGAAANAQRGRDAPQRLVI